MEPIFTDKQLNNMSREDLISLMKIVQEQTKKKDTEIRLLKDKQKELEFLNAMLSDRLTLAQRKQFGASSEKYAEDYEQMNLFNEAEANADAETEELFEEIRSSSYKRKKEKERRKKIFPILRPLRSGPINWKGQPVTVRNAEKNTM
mgnify:FL=1